MGKDNPLVLDPAESTPESQNHAIQHCQHQIRELWYSKQRAQNQNISPPAIFEDDDDKKLISTALRISYA